MHLGGTRMLGAYVVAVTAVVFLAYRQLAGLGWWPWLMFYIVSVLWPAIWTYHALRRENGVTTDLKTRAFAWGPVIVGATTMAAALTLIERALRR